MRERKKKQNEARSNKSKTKTILVSALLDSGPSGYEGDLKKYKRWGGGGGGLKMGRWPIQLYVEHYFTGKENFSLQDKSRKS